MNCSNHEEREAVGMCVRCNKLICEECKVKITNKYYCKECVSEMYSDNDVNNNYNNGSNINKVSQNPKIYNYILGIIAIILLVPKVINNISNIPYFFEEVVFSSRYYGIFSTIFYIIEFILGFIEPIIIIVLAVLVFNNFMKIKREIRIIAPIAVVISFTLIRFISANITSSYFGFHIVANMFSYFIPVILIVVGSYLDKEQE